VDLQPPSEDTAALVSTDLQQFTGLLDVRTGELLTPSVGNAARVIDAARAMKAQVNEIVNEATAYLVSLSEREGTKTLHADNETITVSGGPTIDYDPQDLIDALEAAGCPENRINAAVVQTVSYKVDRAVLRQLAAANPGYRAAIQLAELEVEKPYRASVKLRRNSDES
jgi:hypothetical protein